MRWSIDNEKGAPRGAPFFVPSVRRATISKPRGRDGDTEATPPAFAGDASRYFFLVVLFAAVLRAAGFFVAAFLAGLRVVVLAKGISPLHAEPRIGSPNIVVRLQVNFALIATRDRIHAKRCTRAATVARERDVDTTAIVDLAILDAMRRLARCDLDVGERAHVRRARPLRTREVTRKSDRAHHARTPRQGTRASPATRVVSWTRSTRREFSDPRAVQRIDTPARRRIFVASRDGSGSLATETDGQEEREGDRVRRVRDGLVATEASRDGDPERRSHRAAGIAF
jgi:hypothetical protein